MSFLKISDPDKRDLINCKRVFRDQTEYLG